MYTKYKQLHLPYKHNLQTQTNSNTYFIGTTLFWVLFLHSVAIFLFSLSAGWRSSKLLICVCFRDPSHPAWSSSKILWRSGSWDSSYYVVMVLQTIQWAQNKITRVIKTNHSYYLNLVDCQQFLDRTILNTTHGICWCRYLLYILYTFKCDTCHFMVVQKRIMHWISLII